METTIEIVERKLSDIRSKRVAAALAYWTLKKGERQFPTRADFIPREMKEFLQNVHLYDVLDDTTFRAALLGTMMINAVGKEMTGAIIGADGVHPVARRMFIVLSRTLAARKPLLVVAAEAVAKYTDGRGMETLAAPLSDEGDKITHLFCATAFIAHPLPA